jgi:hypothetical protein
MATRLIGTDSEVPRLPQGVIDASQGGTADDLAPGDTLANAYAYTDEQLAVAVIDPAAFVFASDAETIAGTATVKAVTPAGLAAAGSVEDVRAGGVIGDGVVDDGAALNAFLAANAGKVVVIPAGLNVRTTVPILVPSGITLQGYGATITNASTTATEAFRVGDVTNVDIQGLEIDGAKASYAPVTEQRHGIMVTNSTGVRLRDVYSHDNKGDGLYIGSGLTGLSVDVVVDGCRFVANHRNNCSITRASGVKFYGCTFNAASGTAPQAGVDVEPNATTDVIEDIQFIGCTASGNVGAALLVVLQSAPTVNQRGVSWIGGELSNSTDATLGRGVQMVYPNNVRVVGAQIVTNAAEGIFVINGTTTSGVLIAESTVAQNGRSGIRLLTGNAIVNGCEIVGNGTATPNTFDGVEIVPAGIRSRYQILGCRFDGASQRYGISSNSNAAQVTLSGNLYGTLGTGTVLLADQTATRFRSEQDAGSAAAAGSAPSLDVGPGTASYWSYPATHSTAATIAGVLYLHPVYVPRDMTIDRIACEVTTGSVGSTIRQVIYASNPATGYPQTLVLDVGAAVGTVDGNVVAVVEQTISQALVGGRKYWFGMLVLGGTPTVRTFTSPTWSGEQATVANALGAGSFRPGRTQSGLAAVPNPAVTNLPAANMPLTAVRVIA